MKTFTKQVLICVATTFSMSGPALADDGHSCGVRTLRGTYLFAASGFNIIAGVAQPKAIVEGIDFNGDGTLSVPAATLSVNGLIVQVPPGGVGNYTVEAGCTGKLTFASGPSFDMFIGPSAKHVWMIQTNPNTVLQGTATRMSR
jgi:hypothetical protein